MKTYIIQEIIGFGYWSERYGEFKGFLFAEHYDSEDEAIEAIKSLNKPVTIIPVYS